MRISHESLPDAVRRLTATDPDLAALHEANGTPPLWVREPGFATLVHIILEQQVSIVSARATYDRLLGLLPTPTPAALLVLGDEPLREIGVTRQKRRYIRGLAQTILDEGLDLAALEGMEDQAVRDTLTSLTGIGPWTAEIYLLMALRRPDAWPSGDLALAVAAQQLKALPERPRAETLDRLADPWRPLRAVAARLLWHFYLERRR